VPGLRVFGTRVDEATSMRVLDRYAAAGGSCLGTAPGASREQDGEGRGLKRRIISNMALGPTLLW
jgi:hypothetical protein